MSGTDGGEGDTQMQKFELYIKASAIDKETKGSCPICQQFFMITCLLGENQEDIDFKVFTVQADCPPKNFASGWSKKYPVVMVNSGRNKMGQDISGMMYDTFEELELFFESINKECPELKRKNAPNQGAMKVVENLYKHFNHFIAGQPEKALVGELKKLNEYLEGEGTKYLVDNVLSFSDCHLLPRLQHIRVAGKAFRGFDIPKELTYVWKYLKNAYEQDAFRSTMPSDQDIMFHYEKKAGGPPPALKGKGRATLQKFTYTMDVPEDILNGLDNGTAASADGGASSQVEEEPPAPAPEPTPEPEPEPTVTPSEPEPEPEVVEPPPPAEPEPTATPAEPEEPEEAPAAPVEEEPQQQSEEAETVAAEDGTAAPTEVVAEEDEQKVASSPAEASEEPETGENNVAAVVEESSKVEENVAAAAEEESKVEGVTDENKADAALNGEVKGQVEAS